MKRRIVGAMLVLALTVSMFAGCGKASEETKKQAETETQSEEDGEKAGKELTKISVCEPTRDVLWAPVYAAKALGYFEEEGLDVEITTVQSDMPTAPVLADEAQFGLYGPEMICKFVAEGQETELIYTCSDTYPYSFFMNADEVKDLKGKTINGADSGSSPRAFVRSIVNHAGLDPDNDVNYVRLKASTVAAALESGEIAATYAAPALRERLTEAGFEVGVDIYDKNVHKELLDSETYEMYIVFGKKSYIEKNPEIAQAFVNACYKGAQYLEKNDTDVIVEALSSMFEEDDKFPSAIKACKENGLWSVDGLFSDSGVAAINRMAMDSKLIEKPVAKEDLVNESFALKAPENIK